MKYDFDKIIERRGTGAIKTDGLKKIYGREDLTALWVADMDFENLESVCDDKCRLRAYRKKRPDGCMPMNSVRLDCLALGLDHDSLADLFVNKARLALNDGETFYPGGQGFMRLNVAVPRSVLCEAMERLRDATRN